MTVKQMLNDEQMLQYFRTLENEAMSCIDEDMDLEQLDRNEVFHIGYAMGKFNYSIKEDANNIKSCAKCTEAAKPQKERNKGKEIEEEALTRDIKGIIERHLKGMVNDIERKLLVSVDNYADIISKTYAERLFKCFLPLIILKLKRTEK